MPNTDIGSSMRVLGLDVQIRDIALPAPPREALAGTPAKQAKKFEHSC